MICPCDRSSWSIWAPEGGTGGAFPQILGWMLSDGLVYSAAITWPQLRWVDLITALFQSAWTRRRLGAGSDPGLQRSDTGNWDMCRGQGCRRGMRVVWTAGFLAFFILALKVEESVGQKDGKWSPCRVGGVGAERKTVLLPSSPSGQLQKLFHRVCLHSLCKHFIILQKRKTSHENREMIPVGTSSWNKSKAKMSSTLTDCFSTLSRCFYVYWPPDVAVLY